MKIYNNGQRKSMMYGGAAKRKPMMYGGSMGKTKMGHGGMTTQMSAKPKKTKAPMPMMGAMNNGNVI